MANGKDMTARHFLDTQDFTKRELLDMLELIRLIKEADKQGATPKLLQDASLAMIFEEPSTRTRISFEVAMTELGGHALYLKPGEIHLGVRESLSDTARVISRMVDVIMARTLKHETMLGLAAAYRLLMGMEFYAAMTGRSTYLLQPDIDGHQDRLTVRRVGAGLFEYLWLDGPVRRDTAAQIIATDKEELV